MRYRLLVLAATVVGALIGYTVAQRIPDRYQANTVLILSEPGDTTFGGGDVQSTRDRDVYLAKQVEMITSSAVLDRALELLGSDQSVGDVRDALDVAPSANMAGISIAATEGDPRSAAALANSVATAYEQVTGERATAAANRAIAGLEKLRDRYQSELDATPKSPDGQLTTRQQQLAGQIEDLQQREEDITAQVEVSGSAVEYFEQAQPPTAPSQPKPKLAAALGALLGLLTAGTWAWWAAARDQRAESRWDPAGILEAPLLGEVRPLPAPVTAEREPISPIDLDPSLQDAYHLIFAAMEFELARIGGRSVAVTSMNTDDPKTATTLQIASSASQENQNVLLIDADLRLRQLSKHVDVDEVSSERVRKPVRRATQSDERKFLDRLVTTEIGKVLPVALDPPGLGHPPGAHCAVDVQHAMRSIGEMFDLILIDAPALLTSSKALAVAGQADAVVLVVSHRLAFSHLRDIRDRLAFVKSPLIGYVYVRPRTYGWRTLWGVLQAPASPHVSG